MKFSDKLIDVRRKLHYTRGEMGEVFGVSDTTIYRWETGRGFPPQYKLKKIMEKLSLMSGEIDDDKAVVKICTHGRPLPEKHGEWYDLAVSENITLEAGTTGIIKLGVSVKPPEGYYFLVASRSSTPLKYGLIIANGIGIIESTYCGDDDILGLVVYATRKVSLNKGARIAQMTLVPKSPEIVFDEVMEMGEENRGGYGSTGI